MTIKEEFLSLLERDKEFRYAVAGLLGLEEILRRLDGHGERMARIEEELARLREEQIKLREEQIKLREDMIAYFKRHDEEIAKLREDQAKLREDMLAGFKRHDEEMAKLREDMIAGFMRHDQEIAQLRADMMAGFKRHDEEIAKLRADMLAGFMRHDQEIAKLREDMLLGFRRHDEEIARLREDMNRGFMLVERHISALGARWGLMAEEAFREGVRGIVEGELGFRVERWVRFDGEGFVYGYPSQVEVDVAVHDGRLILVEVRSHVGVSDVYMFRRLADFYERVEGRKPDRLVMVTPYADAKAIEASLRLGVEVYTKV